MSKSDCTSLDLTLKNIANEMMKEDLDFTKSRMKELLSKTNAYTQQEKCAVDPQLKWNMITYKKGKKSSL